MGPPGKPSGKPSTAANRTPPQSPAHSAAHARITTAATYNRLYNRPNQRQQQIRNRNRGGFIRDSKDRPIKFVCFATLLLGVLVLVLGCVLGAQSAQEDDSCKRIVVNVFLDPKSERCPAQKLLGTLTVVTIILGLAQVVISILQLFFKSLRALNWILLTHTLLCIFAIALFSLMVGNVVRDYTSGVNATITLCEIFLGFDWIFCIVVVIVILIKSFVL